MTAIPLDSLLKSSNSGYWGSSVGDSDADVLIIRNGDMKPSVGVRWDALPSRSLRRSEVEKSRVRAGDVLLTTSGDCGLTAYVEETPTRVTCASNFVRILRFDQELVFPKYAFYYTQSEGFRASLRPYIRGTTLQNLSTRQAFPVVLVPLPDLETQRRLAGVLDQMEQLRKKRCLALNLLEELVSARLSTLLSDKRTVYRPLGEVAQFRAGGTLPDGVDFADELTGHLLMKVSDMNRPGNEREITKTALWSEAAGAKSATCPPGSVVIPKRGGSIGTNKKRVTIRSTVLDPNLMAVIPGPELSLAYLFNWFLKFDLTTISNGSSVPQLNKRDLAPLSIPVPPLALQFEFAKAAEVVESAARAYREQLKVMDDAFLMLQRRAFAGSL